MGRTVFKSAVDWWYYGVIGFSALILLAVLATVVTTGSALGIIVVAISLLIGLGLPIWLLVSTHYSIENDHLLVRSGPFSWRIALADIRSVTPSRSALSSPALSLQRLEICYGESKVLLVSPKDQDEFIDALGLGS